jgi:hypothetical protein
MGRDYNSAGADHGQFDKTRWSMATELVAGTSQLPLISLDAQCSEQLCTCIAGCSSMSRRRAEVRS